MTRSLTAGVIAEIATNKLNPVELIYLGISTGTYYTDHYKNLTFDGNTYTASSLFLGSSEVQENADVAVNTLSLKFSGADTTIISLLLNNNYMNKPAKVYMCVADVSSNGSGAGTLTFEPPLRSNVADNAVLIYSNVDFTVGLTGDIQEFTIGTENYFQYEIDLIEVL